MQGMTLGFSDAISWVSKVAKKCIITTLDPVDIKVMSHSSLPKQYVVSENLMWKLRSKDIWAMICGVHI